MKEIKTTRTIEEVIGYKAIDGTFFKDKEECVKYDGTAKAVITAKFKELVVNTKQLMEMTDEGGIPFTEVGEDWYVALIRMTDENDVDTANMYYKVCRSGSNNLPFTKEMIGKDIIVSVGCGYRAGDEYKPRFDDCWCYGVIDDIIARYTNMFSELKGGENNEVQ